MIAFTAGCDNIGPVFSPVLTCRNNVIKSEVSCRQAGAAILAGEVVANVNIFTREFQASRCAAWGDIFFEANHAWQAVLMMGAPDTALVILEDLDFALKPENKRFLPAHELYRLVTRIEDQGPFHNLGKEGCLLPIFDRSIKNDLVSLSNNYHLRVGAEFQGPVLNRDADALGQNGANSSIPANHGAPRIL